MDQQYDPDESPNDAADKQNGRQEALAPPAAELPQPAYAARARRRFSLAGVIAGVVLGCLAALLAFAAMFIAKQSSLPRLTRAAYEAAENRWNLHGPKSYTIDIEFLSGRMLAHHPSGTNDDKRSADAQRDRIHVEVRDGEVTAMTRGGVTPRQRRTWEYWTVPGQLDTIDQELDMAANPVAGFHAPAGSTVIQQADFDPQYGYPLHYRRIVLGTDLEIEWQVTHFEAIP